MRRRVLLGLIAALVFCTGTTAPAHALAFTQSLYGAPVVSPLAGGGVDITVTQPEQGVYYRLGLDPDRVYRVTVDGTTTSGAFTLRTRRNAEPPTYLPSPQRSETYRVEGASEYE